MSLNRRWLIIVFAALMINALLGRWMEIGGWRPDILLAALVFMSMTSATAPAIILGFVVGFYQDLYAAELLGRHALAKTWAAFFAGTVGGKLQIEHRWIQAAILFAASMLHEAVLSVVMGGGVPTIMGVFFVRGVPTALYTTAAGMLLAVILGDWVVPKEWMRRDVRKRRRVR
jgi:rod shape-determining protein MreD